MIKALIRWLEVILRAVTHHNALLLGANQDVSVALFRSRAFIGLRCIGRWENCERVDDPVARRYASPSRAPFRLFPEPVGGAGIERVRAARIESNHERSLRRIGDALNALPMRTGIIAAIDPRASAGEHLLRIRWVHRKAEHVGIVDHAFVNGGPVAATVNGFPGKMKRSGVDDLRVLRVNGE